MQPPASQPVPTGTRNLKPQQGVAGPSRMGASPMSYGAMTGISFTNGGGFSLEKGNGPTPRSIRQGQAAGNPNSYGARFYGDGVDSPNLFSTSITMDPGSFAASTAAFNLPPNMSSSYYRRSYAAAVSGRENLSTSFASMSFQPMSLGTSYSKSKVHSLMKTDAELTKSYECCGQNHEGLHALLEHVEDAHPFADSEPPNSGFSPVTQAIAMDLDLEAEHNASSPGSGSSASGNTNVGPTYPLPTSKATTPDGELPPPKFAPLSLSDVLTSPPNNEVPTQTPSNSSSPPDGSLATPTTSAQPSPVFAVPKVVPARGFLNPARPMQQQKRLDRAFNEVVAAAVDKQNGESERASDVPTAVAPGVLFASAVAGLGIPTTPPVAGQPQPAAPIKEAGDASASTAEPALPQPSLFSTHKPWRCPNPGCNKAYKQSNGLKYHQQKGQCDFAVHDAVDLGLSVEEAEERNRPFVCAVGAGCTKRYRQMNGLKYHYLNSGEHGQYGLRMLQNGTHPQPPSVPVQPPKRYPPITTPVRPSNAPYTIPSHANHGQPHGTVPVNGNSNNVHAINNSRPAPRMGTWPAKAPTPIGIGFKTTPRPQQLPPIQRGRDAVLFSAVNPEPVDMLSRMR